MLASRWIRALIAPGLLACGLLTSPARAQCAPDGLDSGPCCFPTFPNLPAFPAMGLQSTRYIHFNNCQTQVNFALCAVIGMPAPKIDTSGALLCGVYEVPIRIRQCGLPFALWGGLLNADYSRNWQEMNGGTIFTVWRFLLNGDMKPSINLPTSPAWRPPCQPSTGNVYFSGYIDYALDCGTNTWSIAWMLDHDCDSVHHQPGSARPAPATGYHPGRSYNFVGPAAGFLVSPVNPLISNGPITQTAVRRNDWSIAPMSCNFEEPATGNFAPLVDLCVCAAGQPQYNLAMLSANGVCGTTINPSPVGAFHQKRLGAWTNPNIFPGPETLLFDFGYLDYVDGCTGTLNREWFEGVETIVGYPAVEFSGVPLGRQFEDLMSCNQSSTVPATYIGAPHVVNYILNFNMP